MKRILMYLLAAVIASSPALAAAPPVPAPAPYAGVRVAPVNRAPTRNDDGAHGYAAGNYWLQKPPYLSSSPPLLYTTQGVSAGQAEWALLYQNPMLPFGSAISNVSAAYCMVLCVNGYAGNAVQVIRASDSTTQDIGFNSAGVVDVAAMDLFCAGTTCKYTIWYDQSGNGYNCTQSTDALRPVVVTRTVSGVRVFYSYQQPGGGNHTYCTIPSGLATNTQSVSMAFVLKAYGGANSSWPSQIGSVGTNNPGIGIVIQGGTPAQGIGVIANGAIATTNIQTQDDDPMFLAFTSGASSRILYENDLSATMSATTAQAVTGGSIGWINFYGARADYLAVLVYSSQLSATNIATLKAAAYTEFGLVPQYDVNIAAIGDSITVGTGSVYAQDFYAQLATILGETVHIINYGRGGEGCSTIATNYGSEAANTYVAGKTNIASILCGANDIIGGATASAIYANITSLVSSLRATGFKKIIVGTVTPDSAFTSPQQTTWASLNALIRVNTAGADAIADYQADPLIGPLAQASNSTYYTDGLHQTDLGNGVMAGILAPIVANYLPKQ